jgi:hypothetical protein
MKSGPKASRSLVLNLQTRSGHPQNKNSLFPHPSISSRFGEGKIKGSGLSLGLPRPTGGERVGGVILLGLILLLISLGSGWARESASIQARQELEKAARNYLEAEVAGDFQRVYANLYPASDYCRANDFQAYVSEAQSSPVRIVSYKILNIRIAPENPEKEKYPSLEGFARVEVDVTIRYRDSGQESLVNYDFPFVKAGGRWYKL